MSCKVVGEIKPRVLILPFTLFWLVLCPPGASFAFVDLQKPRHWWYRAADMPALTTYLMSEMILKLSTAADYHRMRKHLSVSLVNGISYPSKLFTLHVFIKVMTKQQRWGLTTRSTDISTQISHAVGCKWHSNVNGNKLSCIQSPTENLTGSSTLCEFHHENS